MTMAEHTSFDPSRIGVVTTTQYPDWRAVSPEVNESQVRGDIAGYMLRVAKETGVKTLVIDSEASSGDFREMVSGMDVPIVERTIRSLSGQRREAISQMRDMDVDVILLNDPEKVSVVDNIESCTLPIVNGDADIVIPERRADLFEATYPASQVDYERRQNKYINNALRRAGIIPKDHPGYDWLIGVRFMANKPDVTDLFLREYRYKDQRVTGNPEVAKLLNLEMWPNGQYIPVVEALVRGMKVVGVEIPYEHPYSQTKYEEDRNDEFTKKRKDQTKNIVVGTVQGIKFHQGNPNTLIERI